MLIKQIETHKNSGIPNVSSSLFKTSIKILISQFRFLLNLCLDTAIFPDKWKESIITPLFKSGSLTDPNNYRPIACIPLPGKLLEKCIYNQIYPYLEHYKLLSDIQYGFRRSKSTQGAIFNFLDDIYLGLNSNLNCIATYIDLRKAFDPVNHNLLIGKLDSLNFSEKPLNLISNYLSNRKQQVKANESYSRLLPITTGVPQGSCLGPLLFLIYIDNLSHIVKNCKIIFFADDTVIYHIWPSFVQGFQFMQSDLDRPHLWCRDNLLQVNASKTKSIYFNSKCLNSTSKPAPILIGCLTINILVNY